MESRGPLATSTSGSDVPAENSARVLRALHAFGAPTHDLTVADFDTPDLVVQIGVEPHRIDIMTTVDGVEFGDPWKEREMARVDGLEVPVMSLAHVLQNKRVVGRPRDIADVSALEAEMKRRGG